MEKDAEIERQIIVMLRARIQPSQASFYSQVHMTPKKQPKKWRREWKIELIEQFNPDWRDLFDEIAG